MKKKYCLTECFKRKMSDRFKSVITFLSIAGTLILLMVIVAAISWVVGYVAVWTGFITLGDNLDYATLGLSLITMGLVLGAVLYWIIKLSVATGKTVGSFAKKRYEGEPFECSIFEECKDD